MLPGRAEIESLLERYCWTVNHRQYEEWRRCFTQDGVFDVRGQQLLGRQAIRSYVEGSVGDYRLLRHLLYHPSVEILNVHNYSYQGLSTQGPNTPEDIADTFCDLFLQGTRASGSGTTTD